MSVHVVPEWVFMMRQNMHLAALGQSRLSSNLNQLAHAANIGTLDVSQDTEQQLQDAYACILEIRKALFMALGLKSGDSQ